MRATLSRAFAVLAVAALGLASGGCADPELAPAPSPVLEAPELSMPREEKKTADPPPPIRERRLDTSPQSSQQYIYLSEPGAAPVTSGTAPGPTGPAGPATSGTVNALDRK